MFQSLVFAPLMGINVIWLCCYGNRRGGALTHGSEDEDEDEGAGHQARVPGPLGFVHSWDAQEDEDDGLCDAGQSLHRVLHRRPRLLGNVGLHVFIGSDAAEGHAEEK